MSTTKGHACVCTFTVRGFAKVSNSSSSVALSRQTVECSRPNSQLIWAIPPVKTQDEQLATMEMHIESF